MTVRPPPVVLLLAARDSSPGTLPLAALIESGFEVTDKRHAPDPLAVARTVKPDVVLVDVPHQDAAALELCRSLQADPATKTIPIIVITGDPSIGQFMMTLGARACDATSLHLEVTRVLADRITPPAADF